MSFIHNNNGYIKDCIKCKKCGRKYPQNAPSTRKQYFCSACGEDLPYEKKAEKKPLLPSKITTYTYKKHRNIGIIISILLTITAAVAIYFLFINPLRSISSTNEPIRYNTTSPTTDPTIEPTIPSISPTINPTTNNPTFNPTVFPTIYPTEIPTVNPTVEPTEQPSFSPTNNPTFQPTNNPSSNPTTDPTQKPTKSPSISPTKHPTTVMEAKPFVMGMSIGAGIFVVCVFICVVAYMIGKRSGKNLLNAKQKYMYTERMISHDKVEADDEMCSESDINMKMS
eukprot:525247_1